MAGGADMKAYFLSTKDGSVEFMFKSNFLINSAAMSKDGSMMIFGGDSAAIVMKRVGQTHPLPQDWIDESRLVLVTAVVSTVVFALLLAERKKRNK